MSDDAARSWLMRQVDAGPGTIPSLVGTRLADGVVTAEALDAEQVAVIHQLDDSTGALGRLGIWMSLEATPTSRRWTLELPALDDERIFAVLPATGDEIPTTLSDALQDLVDGSWSWGPQTTKVQAVRHLLDGSTGEVGQVVDELVRRQDVATPAQSGDRRVYVFGATAEARAQLAAAAGTPARSPGRKVHTGWTSATTALATAAVALRLDLAGAAELSQAGARAMLAAMAVRRQVDGTVSRDLRVEVDWWDGVLSALAAIDSGGLALRGELAGAEVETWVAERLAADRRAVLEDVLAELATARWRELVRELVASTWAEPSPTSDSDVLAALADRSLRRVERRLAELGRAQPDHDVLWLVGGCRRAVARARFPGLLAADGRPKRARRLDALLVETDSVLAALGASVRAASLASTLGVDAPPTAASALAHAERRLRRHRTQAMDVVADLRARLRRRRKS